MLLIQYPKVGFSTGKPKDLKERKTKIYGKGIYYCTHNLKLNFIG
jgi:hypothetical protein